MPRQREWLSPPPSSQERVSWSQDWNYGDEAAPHNSYVSIDLVICAHTEVFKAIEFLLFTTRNYRGSPLQLPREWEDGQVGYLNIDGLL